jgi:uncharacterized protein
LTGAAQLCAAFVFALIALTTTMAPMVHAQSAAKFKRDTLSLMTAGGEKKIDIEVAETLEQKSLGLMFRTSLADNQGMLFPYERPQELTMWMKNTYISLDMVFIRADGVVHRIAVRTEPLSERIVASEGDVVAVLELPGGAAERLGLKAGDRVAYPLFGKKP